MRRQACHLRLEQGVLVGAAATGLLRVLDARALDCRLTRHRSASIYLLALAQVDSERSEPIVKYLDLQTVKSCASGGMEATETQPLIALGVLELADERTGCIGLRIAE